MRISAPRKINGVPINKENNFVPTIFSNHSIPADYENAQKVAFSYDFNYVAGDSTFTTGSRYTYPFIVANPANISEIGIGVSGGTTATNFRVAIYKDNGSNYPGIKVCETIIAGATTNTIYYGPCRFVFTQGLYWVSFAMDGGDLVLTCTLSQQPMGHDATIPASDAVVLTGYTASFTYGDFPATYPTGDTLLTKLSTNGARKPVVYFTPVRQKIFNNYTNSIIRVNGQLFNGDVIVPHQSLYQRKGDSTCLYTTNFDGLYSNRSLVASTQIIFSLAVITSPIKVTAISVYVSATTVAAGTKFRFGIYKKTGTYNGILLFDSGDLDGGTVGLKTVPCILNLPIGEYYFATQRENVAGNITVIIIRAANTIGIGNNGSCSFTGLAYASLPARIPYQRITATADASQTIDLMFTTAL